VGNDPTIGGPVQVAAWTGPFLSEPSHNTDSSFYKGGQRRLARLTAFMRAVRAFAHAVGTRGLVGPRGQNRAAPSVVTSAVPGDFAHPTMHAI